MEIIKATDEILSKDCMSWATVNDTIIGNQNEQRVYMPIRRPI